MRYSHLHFVLALIVPVTAAGQVAGYPIAPVPFTAVTVDDAFWAPRIETNRTISIPYAFAQCETTGRVRNFEIADSLLAGLPAKGKFCTRYGFDDSDVYKIIEGAAYSLHTRYDRRLDSYCDILIEKIARAQEPDGYLFTMRTIDPASSWAKERWVNDRVNGSHELYNLGHLFEAAVAHAAATGKRSLLDIATRSADLLCETFGPGKKRTVPGHQGIEIGLARLSLATGKRKYLELAKFFLDERGNPPGETYNQDHLPVVKQTEAVGHAVRAGYMYSGMADVAALTGDESYISAIDRIWNDVVTRKIYVTGGIGAAGNIEGFGAPYELPNLSAYCETCASIANVYWNYRMFLRHGHAKYLDVAERVLYNAFLSGVSMTGDRFFYPNPLEAVKSSERSPWFACACCPSNIVRFVPSIPGYVYAVRGDTIYVNLFIGGSADLTVKGSHVRIRQKSDYPWEGDIRMEVEPGASRHFVLAVRIPGWVRGIPIEGNLYGYADPTPAKWGVRVNGEQVPSREERGFIFLRRDWKKGDALEVTLPMPIRKVVADPRIEDTRGKIAFERGPLVFCLEGQDNKDGEVLSLVVSPAAPLRTSFQKNLFGGVQILNGTAVGFRRKLDGGTERGSSREFTAIPYYAWAHRGRSQMTVWPATSEDRAKPAPAPTIAHTSAVTTSGGRGAEALTDQFLPRHSNDHSVPYFHWWPKKGTTEWIEYRCAAPAVVSSASVYWFDDTGTGECRVPASWTVLYRSGVEWKPVNPTTPFGTLKDQINSVAFSPVETDGLRLEVKLPDGYSAGLYEWEVR